MSDAEIAIIEALDCLAAASKALTETLKYTDKSVKEVSAEIRKAKGMTENASLILGRFTV